MSFWNVDNLCTIVRGVKLARLPESAGDPQGVSTDTRTLRPGQVYIALHGDRFDGHAFIDKAVDAGSPLVIVDRAAGVVRLVAGRAAVIEVDDTQTALTQLAKAYRKTLSGRVIAVTGSAGKTTTKSLIEAVLRTRFKGTVSPKSFNNHIGVPLTILSADRRDDYVICEIGTNAPGEIAALARIADPDVAVITMIGRAHLEGLGGVDGVVREKASLLGHLRPGGLAVVNGDCAALAEYRKVAPAMVTFGKAAGCDLRLTRYETDGDGRGCVFEVNGRWKFRTPLLGEHNAVNALAAIAVGKHMQLSEAEMADGLVAAEPPQMRLNVWTVGDGDAAIRVIDDAYNANPDSMAAALRVLEQYPTKGRRIAVLGDMGELGEQSPTLHRELGERVTEASIDSVVFIGPLCLFAAESALRRWPDERVHAIAEFTDQTAAQVAAMAGPGDTVLVKASRAGGLERIVAALRERKDDAAPTGRTK